MTSRLSAVVPENGRLPDLIFVAHNHLNRLTTYYLDGPADLNQFQSENYMRQLWCNVDPILE
jgi:hypothetical protein